MIWIATVAGSLVLAEFYGYWLHVLLHSYWVPSLSRGHMNHHILSYGPGQRQRSEEYIQDLAEGDVVIAGVGLEWLIPSAVLLVFTVIVEWAMGMSWTQIAVSLLTVLAYTIFLFWWLHDRMHVSDHHLLRNRWTRKAFLRSRKLHDIHHHHVTDDGLMNRNYGIAFFVFDRLFGTFLPTLKDGLNDGGVRNAERLLKKHSK